MMDLRGKLKQNLVLLDKQSTVHMLCNKNLLCNIRADTNPIDIHSSSGVTHWNLEGTIPDIGKAYYKEDGLTNTLSMAPIRDLFDISYSNKYDTFTVQKPRRISTLSAAAVGSTTTTASRDVNPSPW